MTDKNWNDWLAESFNPISANPITIRRQIADDLFECLTILSGWRALTGLSFSLWSAYNHTTWQYIIISLHVGMILNIYSIPILKLDTLN